MDSIQINLCLYTTLRLIVNYINLQGYTTGSFKGSVRTKYSVLLTQRSVKLQFSPVQLGITSLATLVDVQSFCKYSWDEIIYVFYVNYAFVHLWCCSRGSSTRVIAQVIFLIEVEMFNHSRRVSTSLSKCQGALILSPAVISSVSSGSGVNTKQTNIYFVIQDLYLFCWIQMLNEGTVTTNLTTSRTFISKPLTHSYIPDYVASTLWHLTKLISA